MSTTASSNKVQHITALYVLLEHVEKIHLLGCAPTLLQDMRKVSVGKYDVVVALNSSFLYYRPHYHFFACDCFIKNYQNSFDTSMAIIHQRGISFGHSEEYVYNPSRQITTEKRCSLRAGHSILVPALHFAMLCNPAQINLLGFDMRNNDHWDGKSYYRMASRRFPSASRILEEVCELLESFCVPVYCANRESLLVREGLMPCL